MGSTRQGQCRLAAGDFGWAEPRLSWWCRCTDCHHDNV